MNLHIIKLTERKIGPSTQVITDTEEMRTHICDMRDIPTHDHSIQPIEDSTHARMHSHCDQRIILS
jgi:hypothetical protein